LAASADTTLRQHLPPLPVTMPATRFAAAAGAADVPHDSGDLAAHDPCMASLERAAGARAPGARQRQRVHARPLRLQRPCAREPNGGSWHFCDMPTQAKDGRFRPESGSSRIAIGPDFTNSRSTNSKIFQIATTRWVTSASVGLLLLNHRSSKTTPRSGRRYGRARALRAPFFLWASSLDPANRTPLLLTRAT
jgi:hypothetical protein